MKNLKERIYAGETVHGCWLNLGSLVSAEIVGNAGFDWLLIDLEHGAADLRIMYQQLQVLQHSPSTVIVRTDELSRNKVQAILDAGATGIMFPQLQVQQEAELAVRLMYYPPKGVRGLAKMIRATAFGAETEAYLKDAERTIVSIIQIETIEALNNIEGIAATEGVDVLFIGPTDLSLALGIRGQFHHPLFKEAVRKVADAARNHGKIAGILLHDLRDYDMYNGLGFRFLGSGADGSFVFNGAKEMVDHLRQKRK